MERLWLRWRGNCAAAMAGPSLRKISAALAEHGHVTPTGKPYSASAVASMLAE